MAISKAVKRGEVVEDDGGIVDTTNPVNRAYLQADHTVMKRAKAAGDKERGMRSKDRAAWSLRKMMADARYKEEQTDLAIQRRAKELGLLTETAGIEKGVAAIGGALSTYLLTMPRQVAQELFDRSRAMDGTVKFIEDILIDRCTEILVKVKEKAHEAGLKSFSN
jgi:hypothetical protein